MSASPYFIVVFDDEMGACWPYGWDPDCAGALASYTTQPALLFKSKVDARKAIRISARFAQLEIAQGKPANTDFTDSIRHVKIRPCVVAGPPSAT